MVWAPGLLHNNLFLEDLNLDVLAMWCEALSSSQGTLRGTPWSLGHLLKNRPQNHMFRRCELCDGALDYENSTGQN